MEKFIQNDSRKHWSFSHYQNNGLNSICVYPAMMIDDMQKEILEKIMMTNKMSKNLLDPFHGAGTSLIIAQELGIDSHGIDINPLATLITEVKLKNYDGDNLNTSFNELKSRIKNKKELLIEPHSFEKINKWFRTDIINELTYIRSAIIDEDNTDIRKFFWVAFADIARRFSNTRSSTFKLHVKEQKDISSIKLNVVSEFAKKLEENIKKISKKTINDSKHVLWSGDTVELIKHIPESSYDIIFTSPPYGDNGTTVTYGQFSTLQLRWIDSKDLPEETVNVNQNFSSIDSLSLGGRRLKVKPNLISVQEYINTIHESKKAKVIDFMHEYEHVFSDMVRVLKKDGYMAITLGNRRVDNKLVPFNKVHEELAEKYGLQIVQTLIRDIEKKRMAKRVSKDRDGNAIDSMSEEYIMIFRKVDKNEL